MVNEPIQPTKKINKNTKVRAKRSKKLIGTLQYYTA